MNGIGKAMPFTMIAFAIGSFGIIGVPFFNGFVSKWNLLRGAIQGGMPIYVVVLLISAMLGISYLVPVIFTAFFPKNKETEFKEFHEANPFMLVPIMITGVLSVVMGINPNFGPHLYDLATLAADAVMKGVVH
jgi:multicomponent Na+:H+ antiporter subunit D